MMKTCAIMQPTFNPWIGYFDLIDYVDCFIFLDTVQLNQQSWQTRNKFKFQDKEFLFSIPIIKDKHKQEILIQDARIDFRRYDFRKKLFKSLQQNYKKAYFYDEVIDFIEDIILNESIYLADYTIYGIKQIALKLKIKTPILRSSELGDVEGVKADLVLNLCKIKKISQYASPLGAKEYLEKNKDAFRTASVMVEYQKFQHPKYCQLGETFIPYLGILDLIFNEGFDRAKEIVGVGRRYENS